MRVNKVDNNLNFKMALMVDMAARPKLMKLSAEEINKLTDFGEKIKETVLYDVHLNKDLKYEIRNFQPDDKMDYLAELRKEESILGKPYEYTNYCGGCEETVGGWYPGQPHIFRTMYGENAKKEYDKFKALSIEGQLAQYCEMLEKIDLDRIAKRKEDAIKEAEKAKAAMAAEEKKETALNNLFDKYGYKEAESEVIAAKAEEPETKKGFFRRLFHRA